MNAFTLKFPYQITAGDDSILQLAEIASQAGAKRAVVLTDDTIFHIGLTDKAQQLLREAGADITVIHSVPPEPRYDQVMSLYGQTAGNDFDLFVGIGGRQRDGCCQNPVGVGDKSGVCEGFDRCREDRPGG